MHPRSVVLDKLIHSEVICSQKWKHSSCGVSDHFAVTARLAENVGHHAVPVHTFILKSGLEEPMPHEVLDSGIYASLEVVEHKLSVSLAIWAHVRVWSWRIWSWWIRHRRVWVGTCTTGALSSRSKSFDDIGIDLIISVLIFDVLLPVGEAGLPSFKQRHLHVMSHPWSVCLDIISDFLKGDTTQELHVTDHPSLDFTALVFFGV